MNILTLICYIACAVIWFVIAVKEKYDKISKILDFACASGFTCCAIFYAYKLITMC